MNASEDFIRLVMHSFVVTATMTSLGISDIESWPKDVPENLWLEPQSTRIAELDKILTQVVCSFVDI